MLITSAMKQAAMLKAQQMLAEELPHYRYVGNNSAALLELENCIADTAVRSQRLPYTKWAADVVIHMPDGQMKKVPKNYSRTPFDTPINEFLRYLALKSCAAHGFLSTYCIVNKGGDAKNMPSDSFFQLAQDVGLLSEDQQNPTDRAAFIDIQKSTGFGHKWPVLGACTRCWP